MSDHEGDPAFRRVYRSDGTRRLVVMGGRLYWEPPGPGSSLHEISPREWEKIYAALGVGAVDPAGRLTPIEPLWHPERRHLFRSMPRRQTPQTALIRRRAGIGLRGRRGFSPPVPGEERG